MKTNSTKKITHLCESINDERALCGRQMGKLATMGLQRALDLRAAGRLVALLEAEQIEICLNCEVAYAERIYTEESN